ncbi:MAG TPA: hypothetical protein VG816_04490 [Solirubrobacterales bacterium]|nr:hypothetical protein [Solirubrobacterales bacterium]
MGWNPEKDRQLKPSNNPEKKPEFPPKKQGPSGKTVQGLGRTAVRGSQGKR